MALPFRDRRDAGQQLAARLADHPAATWDLVLALPRGGVPVAFEVARALHLPLDICLVRKLGVPGQEELAVGALAAGGVRVYNDDLVRELDLPAAALEEIAGREGEELARRERAYREGRPAPEVRDRAVLVVDDGLATGASMRAAVLALRRRGARQITVAVPVGAPETCAALAHDADAVVCVAMPTPFLAVGAWYDDFGQTTDDEVRALLHRAAREDGTAVRPGEPAGEG